MEDNPEILKIEKLKKYFGGLVAINGLDLNLKKGELRAIIGPNGAGKTTLFNLITGTLSPNEGKIFFRGEDITGLPSYKISHKGIARTLQITSIFPNLTVFENVWSSVQSRKRILNPFIHAMSLTDVREKTEALISTVGLIEKKDQPASDISYGDQRLLEIALALGTEPELLLLDEPTAGLGPGETKVLVGKIRELASKLTILLVEHDMEVVMGLAERITVLHYGEKIAEGTPEEIKGDKEVKRIYLGSE
ncbi:MAG: ABC transporter ATP-binding protein [Thermodesulfobacteriota bacterium]|nr:ABC transporter ATP-binding protein [Thermodesulfobacteriota bacterium]